MKKGLIVLCLGIFLVSFVSARPYYVDCSQGTNGDGSFDTPWNNIGSVNGHAMQTGDDVYFKVGTICKPSTYLAVDWSGTSEDRVIIGAYYGDGQFGLNGNSFPIIDGSTNTVPVPTQYKGLINIEDASVTYVTIENLKIQYSGRYGINIKKSDNMNVDNCYLYRNHGAGITYGASSGDGVDTGIISNNIIENSGYPDYPGHGAALEITASDSEGATTNINVTKNKVFASKHEGIGFYKKVTNSVMEYNVVHDVRSYHLYVASSYDNTVRYNLVYNYDGQFGRTTAVGISVGQEIARTYCYGGATKIYGNLVSSQSKGITLGCGVQQNEGLEDCVCHEDTLIYNNALIDNDQNIKFWSPNSRDSIEVKNNLFWAISDGTTYSDKYSPEGVTWSHNLFYGDGAVTGNAATNAVFNDPDITKKSGWHSLSPDSITYQDFMISSSSPAIEAGTPLASDYNKDFFGVTRPIDGDGDSIPEWDIGAFEYTSSCIENWQCTSWSSWSTCIGGWQTRTRTCTDQNNCGTEYNKPDETETQSCGTGLIAHYTMDSDDIEGATLYDKSGNNNHGTINGALTTQGKINEALNFNGVDDYVSVGSDSSLKPVSSVTACAWTKLSGDGDRDYPQIIGFDTRGYEIDYNEIDDKFNFWVYTNDWGTEAETTLTFTASTEWIHVCGTYDGSTPKLYLNGVKQTDGANTGNINYNSDLHIGGTELSGSYYNGTIDDVRIYNRVLSEAEVLDLYNQAGSICGDSDTNGDSVVSIGELINYISSWKSGSVTIGELINAIGEWKSGC